MSFRVRGLAPGQFRPLFEASDENLRAIGIVRVVADDHGFPCRVSLAEAAPGDELLLLNYEHLSVATPYRSRHAIFVRENAEEVHPEIDEIPESLRIRLLSLRAFDRAGMLRDADVVQGSDLAAAIEHMLAQPEVEYLHLHNAKPGCFAARVDRA